MKAGLLLGLVGGTALCLAAGAAKADTAKSDSSGVVPRAGRPGPPMTLGTSDVRIFRDPLSQSQLALLKSLGFSFIQTQSDHLRVNEPRPGHWDWSKADAGLAEAEKAGMRWQYFPHYHWATAWYRKQAKFVPLTGLRSHRKLALISLWSPDILAWFKHCYAALAAHYGHGTDRVYSLYIGVYGDFGETLFPMGWHPNELKYFGLYGTALPDYWCGDDYARQDFRRRMRLRYHTLARLNAAWGTHFEEFDQVDYPAPARRAGVAIGPTPGARRYWLDFVQWYYDSMTRFTGEVCKIARHYFPKALLQLPVGGGAQNLMYGEDTSRLPKIARPYGVQVRSTHGGYAPFAQGYAAMIKCIATPCKIYGVPHWLEPPGTITPDREVSRIMEALSCGNTGFWDWAINVLGATNIFHEYKDFFTRETPVVDVALFFPTTDHRLHPDLTYPRRLQSVGARLREVLDFDIVDEELIADQALQRYRVLVWVEGKFIEAKTLKTMAAWVRQGGVLVRWNADPPETVEGNTRLGSAWLGLTKASSPDPGGPLKIQNPGFLRHLAAAPDGHHAAMSLTRLTRKARVLATVAGRPAIWAMPHGKGWVIVGDGDRADFNNLVRDVTYNLSKLDATKPDALEVDADWDGVYATRLSDDEVILYNSNPEPRHKSVCGTQLLLPGNSLRSVLVHPSHIQAR